jgi:hypothetical protein
VHVYVMLRQLADAPQWMICGDVPSLHGFTIAPDEQRVALDAGRMPTSDPPTASCRVDRWGATTSAVAERKLC